MRTSALPLAISALAVGSAAGPLVERQSSCASIHVFGGRETTAPAGYGSAGTFVNLILNAYPGSTSEAINYPAAGGTNAQYASSVQAGTADVANQINAYNKQCPNAKLVYVGYSQGAEIADNAICGGGDSAQGYTNTAMLLTSGASTQLKAIVWAGNPRHSSGEPFNYGSCTAGGFSARPNGFTCSPYTSRIRSYCDAPDPYCCNGNNATTHNGYGQEYGQNALAFVKSLLG